MSLSDEIYNRICWQFDTHQHDRVCYLLDDLGAMQNLTREALQTLILDASDDAASLQRNVEDLRADPISTIPKLQAKAESNRKK
jgi:hypothetical protein